jgi:hypothetical protein
MNVAVTNDTFLIFVHLSQGGVIYQRLIILVEDIPLNLKYNIKMKWIMHSVWHNYLFILFFLLLATSFRLNRPSSGQYLQELKSVVAYSITRQFYRIPFTFIISLCNYYQLLVVLSVVSFVEILWYEHYICIIQVLVDWQHKIMNSFENIYYKNIYTYMLYIYTDNTTKRW